MGATNLPYNNTIRYTADLWVHFGAMLRPFWSHVGPMLGQHGHIGGHVAATNLPYNNTIRYTVNFKAILKALEALLGAVELVLDLSMACLEAPLGHLGAILRRQKAIESENTRKHKNIDFA